MMDLARADMSLIDCLSSPLTIAQKCFELNIVSDEIYLDKLVILCTGASAKAEERILRETNCWHELRHCFALENVAHIELWLIGPEISASDSPYRGSKHALGDGLSFHLFRGTNSEFFRQYPARLNGADAAGQSVDCVVVGLNCGFGNWENHRGSDRQFGLLYDWLADLYLLSSLRFPLVFTCANDYADVAGETLVMSSVLGMSFVSLPAENHFSFASTLVTELPVTAASGRAAGAEAQGYSRGNSFVYVVQGPGDKARRAKLNLRDRSECLRTLVPLLAAAQRAPPDLTRLKVAARSSRSETSGGSKLQMTEAVRFQEAAAKQKKTAEAEAEAAQVQEAAVKQKKAAEAKTAQVQEAAAKQKKAAEAEADAARVQEAAARQKKTADAEADAAQVQEAAAKQKKAAEAEADAEAARVQEGAVYSIEQTLVEKERVLAINILLSPVAAGRVALRDIEFYIGDDGTHLRVQAPSLTPGTAAISRGHTLLRCVDCSTVAGKLHKKTQHIAITARY